MCSMIIQSVCLSVGLSVTRMYPAKKSAGLITMLFGMWVWVGPSNHVLDEGPDPPRETGMLMHARARYIQQHDAAFYRIYLISC